MSAFDDTTRSAGVDDTTETLDDLVHTSATPVPTPPPPPTPTTSSFEADRADAAAAGSPDAAAARPTVRWGALVWSLIFAGIAAATLWVAVDSGRRDALGEWLLELSPVAASLYALLALGVLIVVFGLVALIRRSERAAREAG
jgi:hypothetical protein